MAELASAPIVIGTINGGWWLSSKIRQLRPKVRVPKHDKKLAAAAQMVNAHLDKIPRKDLEEYLSQHEKY
ncbi:hypothetical protein NLJ89_g6054 [Agrocybe chaxingu]|uniref:Uncharacterized protein n=1 Tax=Agrocybe chaxingu TaxID=84603 RepID=A0A9W8JZI5_9AGAR|nr:hypothetical protein NLJ89_g6054 [Agrocybe chaxingu]